MTSCALRSGIIQRLNQRLRLSLYLKERVNTGNNIITSPAWIMGYKSSPWLPFMDPSWRCSDSTLTLLEIYGISDSTQMALLWNRKVPHCLNYLYKDVLWVCLSSTSRQIMRKYSTVTISLKSTPSLQKFSASACSCLVLSFGRSCIHESMYIITSTYNCLHHSHSVLVSS